MTRLHDALHELAGEAPQADLTGRVIARARRRRRVRLLAVPGAAAGMALVVAAGVLLGGAGTDRAIPQVTPSEGPLNVGPVPGPLPEGAVEPVKYAYLDWCKQPISKIRVRRLLGGCEQWRVVGRSGRQWRVADALGIYPPGAGNDMNPWASLEISGDGRRIAYYRPADRRFVARDLVSGRLTVIDQPVPEADLYSAAARLIFSADGRRLSISYTTAAGKRRALLADTETGAVQEMPGTSVVGLARDASTVVLAEWKRDGAATLVLAASDGTVRDRVPLDPDAFLEGWGDMLSPDGRTLLVTLLKRDEGMGYRMDALESVGLVDVQTGKVTATRRLELPSDVADRAQLVSWAGPRSVFVATGDRGYLVDLDTGRARLSGAVTLLGEQTVTIFGGYAS